MTDIPQYEETYFGGKMYVERTGKFGQKVKAMHGKGSGMNTEFYSLGNIGWWLSIQRERAGVTRSAVAQRMGFPGGAIKAIEEGTRVPVAKTVEKYLTALRGMRYRRAYENSMYKRFH